MRRSRGKRLMMAGLAAVLPALGPAFQAAADICETVRVNGQFNTVITYCASSVLPPQAGNHYGPSRLGVTASFEEAWCEGSAGHGIGERVEMHFDQPGLFRTVIIMPGYQKSARIWEANGRPSRVTLDVGGAAPISFDLPDRMGELRLTLPSPVETSRLALTIDAVHPGSRWQDTCITFLAPDLEELNYR